MQLVFDGHNDVLLRLWTHERDGNDPVAEFLNGTTSGHIDGPRARQGGLAGGLCAIYVPSGDLVFADPDQNGHYETPMAAPLDRLPSLGVATEMAAIALRLDKAGAWRLCRTVKDIRNAMANRVFAAVMHMEGCEAIGPDLSALEVFHAAGLRSLGPVWSRHNVFGHGVPFAFPMSPDTAPGLTGAGFELVHECNRLGIMIDLSHITEKGFWDVAKTTDQPLVATHSNVHALTPVARNLTDKQLDAIRESKGLIGLNYATAMLRADGRSEGDTPIRDMIRHINYLVDRVGIDCVALGSDFDGATIPDEIGDAAGNQKLIAALRDVGYGEEDRRKLASENWLRILASAWGEKNV